jgi:hypothetical protein
LQTACLRDVAMRARASFVVAASGMTGASPHLHEDKYWRIAIHPRSINEPKTP